MKIKSSSKIKVLITKSTKRYADFIIFLGSGARFSKCMNHILTCHRGHTLISCIFSWAILYPCFTFQPSPFPSQELSPLLTWIELIHVKFFQNLHDERPVLETDPRFLDSDLGHYWWTRNGPWSCPESAAAAGEPHYCTPITQPGTFYPVS
jgi:hypothetical protein